MKLIIILFAVCMVTLPSMATAQWNWKAGAFIERKPWQPFIQAGIASAQLDGYTKPNPFIEPGVEYDGAKLTSISYFDYSPLISKGGVNGFGRALGGESLDYWKVSEHFSFGGGISFKNLTTQVWSKSSLYAAGGGMLSTAKGRIYLNYFRAIALDQNHSQDVKLSIEAGYGRLRPMVSMGVSHFTEPSYCQQVCTGHIGAEFEAGIKIMVRKGAGQ